MWIDGSLGFHYHPIPRKIFATITHLINMSTRGILEASLEHYIFSFEMASLMVIDRITEQLKILPFFTTWYKNESQTSLKRVSFFSPYNLLTKMGLKHIWIGLHFYHRTTCLLILLHICIDVGDWVHACFSWFECLLSHPLAFHNFMIVLIPSELWNALIHHANFGLRQLIINFHIWRMEGCDILP